MDLIASILGSGQSATLEKLKILVEKSSKPGTFDEANPIVAKFNPSQLTINKSVNWDLRPRRTSDTGESQFTHGEPATFVITLLFDTYTDDGSVDVRKAATDRLYALMKVASGLHRPPLCKLQWGKFGVIFTGVLQSLNQTYTLFLADGTPVRATLACTFREWLSSEEEAKQKQLESSDVAKTRIVRAGDTLSNLAAEEYRDATLWRPIAEANGIDDPRTLAPGRSLAIPPLKPGAERRR